MERLTKTLTVVNEAARLVDKEVPAMWILWAYAEAYQTTGTEFKGAH
jgi:hypothetical protein